jgi:quercetin dioxygenase-like cupin family protein
MIVRNIKDEEVKQTFFMAHGGAHAWTLLGWDVLKNFEGFWYSILKPGMISQIHNHPMEEIFFFLQGGSIMSVDNDKRKVRSGDAVWIPPYAVHGLVNNGDMDSIYIVVGATPNESRINLEDLKHLK